MNEKDNQLTDFWVSQSWVIQTWEHKIILSWGIFLFLINLQGYFVFLSKQIDLNILS